MANFNYIHFEYEKKKKKKKKSSLINKYCMIIFKQTTKYINICYL